MAKLLLGKEVNASLLEDLAQRTEILKAKGITPKLAMVRCGEKPSDISYEKVVETKAAPAGVEIEKHLLPEDVSAEKIKQVIEKINNDPKIHGCLILCPLPEHLRAYQDDIFSVLSPEKDVDGMTEASAASLLVGGKRGFAPCAAEACMQILRHYNIDLIGKKVTVIGRSLIVGKPAALLLSAADATVTLCHRKTADLAEHTRSADIIISSAGELGILTEKHVSEGQTVIDVSMNWDRDKINSKGGRGAMAGDAVFESVEPIVDAITPVPGGVGAVTSTILIKHTVESAERIYKTRE